MIPGSLCPEIGDKEHRSLVPRKCDLSPRRKSLRKPLRSFQFSPVCALHREQLEFAPIRESWVVSCEPSPHFLIESVAPTLVGIFASSTSRHSHLSGCSSCKS